MSPHCCSIHDATINKHTIVLFFISHHGYESNNVDALHQNWSSFPIIGRPIKCIEWRYKKECWQWDKQFFLSWIMNWSIRKQSDDVIYFLSPDEGFAADHRLGKSISTIPTSRCKFTPLSITRKRKLVYVMNRSSRLHINNEHHQHVSIICFLPGLSSTLFPPVPTNQTGVMSLPHLLTSFSAAFSGVYT